MFSKMAASSCTTVKRKNMDFVENNSDNESDFSSDDSVLDKTFNPSDSSSDSSSVSENSEERTTPVKKSKDDKSTRISIKTPEKPGPSKWRRQNVELRKKVKAKVRRNMGYVYKNVKGKENKARSMGEPCKCKGKCRELLEGTEINIFNSFWDLETYEKQNTYLLATMKAMPKKRSYPKKTKGAESKRKVTYVYYVKVNGKDVQICKTEFLSVHGLQNSSKRVKLIAQQIAEGRITPKKDGRGKHSNRPNRIHPDTLQSVHDHIRSIPKYISHYSRNVNPNRVYLNHDLNISSLYKDYYVDWCKDRNIIPATEDRYRRIFCLEYNIGFKLPKSDTCHTCDFLTNQIEANKDNESNEKDLRTKLELHQRRAEAMQKNLKQEIEENKTNKTKDIISFDLQQTLPTPSLTVGPAFYLRKAWTYNLGIHDCMTGKGSMYMWPETVAKRGSAEIASIVLKHIVNKPTVSESLVVFTDNCGGQNKNWLIMGLWVQLVREKKYQTIEHRFLVSGHTHLPSDRDFALIEKHKKYINQVYSPDEWYDIVRKSNRKYPFDVIVMRQNDFFSFEEFSLPKKTVTSNKQPLKFNEIRCFKFESAHPNTMFIKHTLNGEIEAVNIGKRGTRLTDQISIANIKPKYDGPVKLNSKKINDLNKLLKYIPPISQKFFTDIIGSPTPATEEAIVETEENPENIDGDVNADMETEDFLDI